MIDNCQPLALHNTASCTRVSQQLLTISLYIKRTKVSTLPRECTRTSQIYCTQLLMKIALLIVPTVKTLILSVRRQRSYRYCMLQYTMYSTVPVQYNRQMLHANTTVVTIRSIQYNKGSRCCC